VEDKAPGVSVKSAREGGKMVSGTFRPPLSPRR